MAFRSRLRVRHGTDRRRPSTHNVVGHNKVSVKENDEDQPDIVRKMISETENAYQNEQY